MSENINFLAKEQKIIESRNKNDKRSFFFVFFLVAVAGIAFAVIWFINNHFIGQINQVEKQVASIKNTISSNQNREKEYLIFYEKLTKLAQLIKQRSHGTRSLVSTYDYFLTEDTSIASSTYDYYTTNLELDLVCNSVFGLPTLFNLVHDPQFVSQYQNVELLSLNRTAEGTYRLKINLEL